MNKTQKAPNLFWKYVWHQKGSLMLSGVFSIFFGLGSLFVTFGLITILYYVEYFRAIRELEVERRHEELLHALGHEPKNKADARKVRKIAEEIQNSVDTNQWGEA